MTDYQCAKCGSTKIWVIKKLRTGTYLKYDMKDNTCKHDWQEQTPTNVSIKEKGEAE